MKNNILTIILVIAFLLTFSACSPQEPPQPPKDVNANETTDIGSNVDETLGEDTESTETSLNPNKWEYDEAEEYRIAIVCEEPPYMRWYPSNLYSVGFAYDFAEVEEVNAIFDSFEGNEDLHQYPTAYTIIKLLSISKENIMQVETDLSPEQIEIFYSGCSDEEFKQKLKADHIFYYDGWIYNIYDLAKLETAKLQEMADNSNLAEFVESFWDRYGVRKNLQIINALSTITEKIIG